MICLAFNLSEGFGFNVSPETEYLCGGGGGGGFNLFWAAERNIFVGKHELLNENVRFPFNRLRYSLEDNISNFISKHRKNVKSSTK